MVAWATLQPAAPAAVQDPVRGCLCWAWSPVLQPRVVMGNGSCLMQPSAAAMFNEHCMFVILMRRYHLNKATDMHLDVVGMEGSIPGNLMHSGLETHQPP